MTHFVWVLWYAAVGAIARYLAAEVVHQPGRRLMLAVTWPLWAVVSYLVAVYCAVVVVWRGVRGRV